MKIKRYYISGIIDKGVARSQMFNWANLLKEKKIETTFIFIFPSKEKAELKKMIVGENIDYVTITKKKIIVIRELIIILILMKFWLKDFLKYKKIVFQVRTPILAFSFLRLLPKCYTVFEIRGQILVDNDNSIDIHSRKYLNKKRYRNFIEKNMFHCNKIICVSNKLKNYYLNKYNVNSNKFNVVYGAADNKLFYYSNDKRNHFRHKYNVKNKVVYLYAGNLDKSWQIPNKIFELFNDIHKKTKDSILLILTPNKNIAEKYKCDYKISNDHIIIEEHPFKDLINFYNMADFGLLLREDKLINNTASPTKFSEYMLCGLPIIISKNVGDFSSFVDKEKIGIVIDIDSLKPINSFDIETEIDIILKKGAAIRSNIASKGQLNFSKQRYIEWYLEFYQEL